MSLPAKLPILPFTRPVRGEVTLPGSKSITNRALLLAALCDAPVTLTGALFSEDTHLMAEALRRLGFTVDADESAHTLRVSDQAKGFPASPDGQPAEIFVGLAGTAARFLTALCAAAPRGVYRIDGIPQMRKRPMKGLIDALRQLGADIRCTGVEGFFPLEIHANGLRGAPVNIDASESSQMLSALFMVAPKADSVVEVTPSKPVRWPFVEMTKNIQGQFGLGAGRETGTDTHLIRPGNYQSPTTYRIEPDATAASYFLTLPLVVGGSLYLPDLKFGQKWLQGDVKFIEVLRHVGVEVNERLAAEDSVLGGINLERKITGTDVVYNPPASRIGVTQDFSEFSDTFLTLAAISPLLAGPSRITGIAHTRKQETDRVAGMVRELRKLGQDVHEHEDGDGLTVIPRPLVSGVEIETYGDHRFAMSFGILGCHDLHGDGRPWLTIKDPACCAKTFPHFFELLESLRQKSLAP